MIDPSIIALIWDDTLLGSNLRRGFKPEKEWSGVEWNGTNEIHVISKFIRYNSFLQKYHPNLWEYFFPGLKPRR